ncbi:MAG: hypothetical protein ACPG31_07155 [Planctomycetota bacterium]
MKSLIHTLCAAFCLLGCLTAQEKALPEGHAYDPYTRHEAEAMEAAGYVRFGRMPWGDSHTTADIEKALAGEPLIWVETEHFRIGSTLGAYTVDRNDRVETRKVRAELERLREFLPRAPKKAKTLDPWLRLHLYAMRVEDLYDEIQEVLLVTDEDFPLVSDQSSSYRPGNAGPYLGMKNKFTLLLTENKSTLARYASAYCNIRTPGPVLHHFPANEVQFFGLAAELDNMSSDTTMHCMVTYGLTINLLDGYLGFRHSVPPWVSVGMAHHKARAIDEKRNYFNANRTFGNDDKDVWDWEVRVRGRVKNDADPEFAEMAAWPDHTSLEFTDNMIAWARVDFLLQERPEELAEFLRVVKSPFPSGTVVDASLLEKHQIQAFQAVLSLNPAEFDTIWRAWVPNNYRKK